MGAPEAGGGLGAPQTPDNLPGGLSGTPEAARSRTIAVGTRMRMTQVEGKRALMDNDTSKPPKIACEKICKTFIQKGTQQVHVLEDISLEVFDNEFLVILGPGQSGKSTLLRIIAGLETPSTGRAMLDGREVSGPGPDRGLVFQSYMLFAWRTVLGNVEMGPKLQGVGKKERREIAQHYIDLVGLTGFEKHYPHQLSGGMKQRVGIARAYANNPQVMLLDEPFGQLDAQTRLFMEKETERIWQAEKRTVIFVTNNIDEAIILGDRIVTMVGKLPGRMGPAYPVELERPREPTDMRFLKLRYAITEASELVL
jgi:NitT/TauT family transport system ATP-binding protein/sulfonate transport system ATP-binding protein